MTRAVVVLFSVAELALLGWLTYRSTSIGFSWLFACALLCIMSAFGLTLRLRGADVAAAEEKLAKRVLRRVVKMLPEMLPSASGIAEAIKTKLDAVVDARFVRLVEELAAARNGETLPSAPGIVVKKPERDIDVASRSDGILLGETLLPLVRGSLRLDGSSVAFTLSLSPPCLDPAKDWEANYAEVNLQAGQSIHVYHPRIAKQKFDQLTPSKILRNGAQISVEATLSCKTSSQP